MSALPPYVELRCLSNFSFLRGASWPEELVARAKALGYGGLALTDECSLAGIVRAHVAAKEHGLPLLVGSQFQVQGEAPFGLVVLACDANGYGNLCEFITRLRRRSEKGRYALHQHEIDAAELADCVVLAAPQRRSSPEQLLAIARWLLQHFMGRSWLAVELLRLLDDEMWLHRLREVSALSAIPLVASGDIHMHLRSRKPLQDVLTAIRLGRPIADCGFALQPNAERHLRSRLRLAAIHPQELLDATLEVLRRCAGFDLAQIRYDYPQEALPAGLGPTQALRRRVREGMAQRYPRRVPVRIKRYLVKELKLIAACRYEMFFLTVDDIVAFARRQGILCQGRGSAANSVVCWCLGITAADPEHSHPLLERFISLERRHEPPDIDVDFEHERREEVIQHIYARYGRARAALAAAVITYRTRSAIRDVGGALGLPESLIDAFATDHHWFDDALAADRLQQLAQGHTGAALDAHRARLWLELVQQLIGFPRHLSQHVGGFVLTQSPLTRIVPVENAAMPDRSVIQWDKDDLEAVGLMKVDVLALGMLSAIRRCLDLVSQRRGTRFTRYDIVQDDPATYAMVRRADTVGVFQIESRAQMSMLPRLKPAVFYDLVVEVAIVRPGPISGGMVHPYLEARRRRDAGEAISYERSAREAPTEPPRLQKALERTLGIPIFQEQVMEIAMIAAGFSAGEADELRRGMAAWKRSGNVARFEGRLINGMLANGYQPGFAQRIFEQIKGFGEYGFPESHAYSFALLAYESSWLKCHEPECFLAALLNSQPMGFYPPSQLIQDARRHGVVVLPPDASVSDWDCTLESVQPIAQPIAQSIEQAQARAEAQPEIRPEARPAVRLGLRLVGSFSEAAAARLMQAREEAPFAGTEDLALRAGLDRGELGALAAADALKSLAGHRRQQAWDAAALQRAPALLRGAPVNEPRLQLPPAPEAEEITLDYAALGRSEEHTSELQSP